MRPRLTLSCLLLSAACSLGRGAGPTDEGEPAPTSPTPTPRPPGAAVVPVARFETEGPLTDILRSRLDPATRRLFVLTRSIASRDAGPARPSGLELLRIELDSGQRVRLFGQGGDRGPVQIAETVWIGTHLSRDGKTAYLTTSARANEQMMLYRVRTNGEDATSAVAESLGTFSKNIYYRQSDAGALALFLRYDEATLLEGPAGKKVLESSVGRGDVSEDGRFGLIRTQLGAGSSLLVDSGGETLRQVDHGALQREVGGDLRVYQSLLTGLGDVFTIVGEADFRRSHVLLYDVKGAGPPLLRITSERKIRRYLDLAVAPTPGREKRASLSYTLDDPRQVEVEIVTSAQATSVTLKNVGFESENLKGFDEGLTHFLEFAGPCLLTVQLGRQVDVLDTCAVGPP